MQKIVLSQNLVSICYIISGFMMVFGIIFILIGIVSSALSEIVISVIVVLLSSIIILFTKTHTLSSFIKDTEKWLEGKSDERIVEVREKIKKWKKQGYKVDKLEKMLESVNCENE